MCQLITLSHWDFSHCIVINRVCLPHMVAQTGPLGHQLQPPLGARPSLAAVCQTVYLFLAPSPVSFMTLPDLSLPLTSRSLLPSRPVTLRPTPASSSELSPLHAIPPNPQLLLPTSSHSIISLPTTAKRKVALLLRADPSLCVIHGAAELSRGARVARSGEVASS